MKVQVKSAIKSYFLSSKKQWKSRQALHKIFFNLPYQCAEVPISPNSKLMPHFLLPFFFEECHNRQVRINKMVSKLTADYHPSPSQLTSRIHPHISMDSQEIYLSRNFLQFFSKPVFSSPWSRKSQIYSVKVTGNYISEPKNWICSFLLIPQAEGNH